MEYVAEKKYRKKRGGPVFKRRSITEFTECPG